MTACARCGRPLRKPSSVARGIGPKCAEEVGSGLADEAARRTGAADPYVTVTCPRCLGADDECVGCGGTGRVVADR